MKPRGFIALMSAIIISGVLLMVAAAGSLAGFYTRSNVVDTELKERSVAAADACADQALVGLAVDQNYAGNEARALNSLDVCKISAVTTSGTLKKFTVQATSSAMAVTNLQITYSTTTQSVLSWLEVP